MTSRFNQGIDDAGMGHADRAFVRRYLAANKRQKTMLRKIAQIIYQCDDMEMKYDSKNNG